MARAPDAIEVVVAAPDTADARHCLGAYFRELAARFDAGFDPARSISASDAEMTPPAGFSFLAREGEAVLGCGALKCGREGIGEVKRMWTAREARGRGVARQVLRAIETSAREAGLARLRLETNRSLVEAQKLYRAEGFVEVPRFNDEPYAHHWFEKRL